MYKTNIDALRELANALYWKYNDYYWTVNINYLMEAVDNAIQDLQGVVDLEDLHKCIKENYI
jgi:hypothetical protein